MPTKILLAGEGGQGVQAVSKIIINAARQINKKVSYIPSFGVEQRGGVSLAYVQISSKEISYPRFDKADIVVVFCNRAIERIENNITDRTLFIYDSSAIKNEILDSVKSKIKNYLAVPAQEIAKKKFSIKALNMLLLGALAAQIKEIPFSEIEKAMNKEFEEKILKNPAIKETNFNALKEGMDIAEKFDQGTSEFKGIDKKELINEFEKDGKKWTRFPEYCKGCALCIARCPVGAIKFSDDVGFLGNPLPIVDIEKCIGCGMCEKTCPDGAIKIDKK